jgi:ubiquinone biosynthesis protein UbiJ
VVVLLLYTRQLNKKIMQEIILEKIINKLATDKVIDLSDLNSKTIVLTLSDINFNFCFFINNNQIFIFDEVKPADATISIKFRAFLDLLNKQDLTDLFREDKVVVVGEVKTAQLLIDMLKNATIKEKITSALPTPVVDIASKIKEDIITGKLKDNIISMLIQPKVYS